MLILLFVVCILGAFLCNMVSCKVRDIDAQAGFEITSAICAFISVITFCVIVIIAAFIVNGRTIDRRIEMYTEQNQAIESSISDLVATYMDHESETFANLSPDSAITLVSMYPDLKSDSLVEQQCNLYIENNQKITELKEDAIKLSNYKWWLYFGK